MPDQPKLTVLGAGSWGTALAALTARNGVATRLWGRDAAALAQVAAQRCNARYLPGVILPAELHYEADLGAAVRGAHIVLIVVPSHAFAAMLEALAPLLDADTAIAWATKGFEPGTGRFMHELVAQKLPGRPAAVVTGPSFAREVATGLPSAVTVHSDDDAFAQRLANLLHASNLRAYSGRDVLGAELGGAMKNVLAVRQAPLRGVRRRPCGGARGPDALAPSATRGTVAGRIPQRRRRHRCFGDHRLADFRTGLPRRQHAVRERWRVRGDQPVGATFPQRRPRSPPAADAGRAQRVAVVPACRSHRTRDAGESTRSQAHPRNPARLRDRHFAG